MAPYAVIVTARQSWHGKDEEFDFVFHYDTGPAPSTAGWIDLLNAVKDALKPLYGPETRFLRGRVHGPTNAGKDADQMRAATDFASTQVGTASSGSQIAPELAVIIEWDLGRSEKGYRQILKKFVRGCTIPSATTGQVRQVDALGTTQKAPFVTAGNTLKAITLGAVTNNICNPAGKNFPSSEQPTVVNYVHHRQMKRGRKRKRTAA